MAISHAFSNAIPDGTNTQIVRPIDWNSAHNFTQNLAGNTAGVSSVAGTDIVWAGGANITLSANGSTISVVGGAGAAADGGVGISAGAASVSAGTVVFSNSNGVSFGLNGSTVTATVATNYQSQGAYLTTARASNDAIGLNSAVSNVTATINSSGLSLDARGYAGTATTFNGANLSGSMTVNSVGVQLSLSAAAPGAGAVNFSAGTTSGNLASVVFSNSNGVSFGLDGSTITASAAGGGGGGQLVYFTQAFPVGGCYSQSNQAVFGNSINSVAVYPFDISASMAISAIAIPVSITNSSTASSSGQVGLTLDVGIYTQGTDTTRVDSLYTTNYTLAASNSSNASRAVSWIVGIVNATSYSTNSSSSAGTNLSSLFHGAREFQLPYETTLTPGRYWAAFRVSQSVAGTSNGVLSANIGVFRLGLSMAMYPVGSLSNAATVIGALPRMGLGILSVTSAALPDSIAFTNLSNEGNYYPVMQLRRSIY